MPSFSTVILSTMAIMMIAELGDKTNLLQISLVARYRNPYYVLTGALIGILLVTIIGALIGDLVSQFLPSWLIPLISGVIFIWLGVSGIFSKENDDEVDINDNLDISPLQILKKSMYIVGLAEFGDKSQIFVISNAIINDPLAVVIGAFLGMAVVSMMAVFFGTALLKKIPEEQIHKFAAILFIIAGFWIIITAVL